MYIMKHPSIKDLLVSSDGQVFIPKSNNTPAHWTFGTLTKRGYRVVKIKYKRYYVHRLIAETFIPNFQNKPCVDHIDRNPSNNSVENLRWATISENCYNTKRNRPIGKQLKDFASIDDYLRDYNREYARKHKRRHSI